MWQEMTLEKLDKQPKKCTNCKAWPPNAWGIDQSLGWHGWASAKTEKRETVPVCMSYCSDDGEPFVRDSNGNCVAGWSPIDEAK